MRDLKINPDSSHDIARTWSARSFAPCDTLYNWRERPSSRPVVGRMLPIHDNPSSVDLRKIHLPPGGRYHHRRDGRHCSLRFWRVHCARHAATPPAGAGDFQKGRCPQTPCLPGSEHRSSSPGKPTILSGQRESSFSLCSNLIAIVEKTN